MYYKEQFNKAASLCWLKQAGIADYRPFNHGDAMDASVGLGLGGAALGGGVGALSTLFEDDEEKRNKETALKRGLIGALAGGAVGAGGPQALKATKPLVAMGIDADINHISSEYENEIPWLLKKLVGAGEEYREEVINEDLPIRTISELSQYPKERKEVIDYLKGRRKD